MEFMCTHARATHLAAHLHVKSNMDAWTLAPSSYQNPQLPDVLRFDQLHLEFKVLLLSKEYRGLLISLWVVKHAELLSAYH